jgi:hypothetical protein
MNRVTRRFFLLSTAALSAGCVIRERAAATAAQNVRQPVPGQSWRYAKYDLFTRSVLDEQVDRVRAVDHTVEIDSSYEAAEAAANPGWGAALLKEYATHSRTSSGPLASEIQSPWGMLVLDPHWGQVQVYETPIPLWPSLLQPGWLTHISTNYKTPADQGALRWDQTMRALAWETVTVPAGQFRALRFTNHIKFKHDDFSRTDSVRRETIWFAPEVGRWVARESHGTYYFADSRIKQPYNESGYRWELLGWS